MTVGGSDSVWSEPLTRAPELDVAGQLTSGGLTSAAQTWLAADTEIATVVHAGCDMAERAHREIFYAAGSSGLYDPESDDEGSAYWKHSGRLDLDTQRWFTIASGIVSCVANFELYLEEVSLQRLVQLRRDRTQRTPRWEDLRAAWSEVDVKLAAIEVTGARDLRHQVAHRLDEDRVSHPSPSRRPWPHFTTDATGGGRLDENAGTVALTPQRFENEVRQPLAAKVAEIDDLLSQSS